jgi:hypothetical protein
MCDITYVQTGQGFLFLAAVQDVYSRRIVGWSIRNDLHAELALDALGMAVTARATARAGVIAHPPQSNHGLGISRLSRRRSRAREARTSGTSEQRGAALLDRVEAVARGALRNGRTSVAVSRIDTRPPERIDLRPSASAEADMQSAGHGMIRVCRPDRPLVPLDELGGRVRRLNAQNAEHGAVEAL